MPASHPLPLHIDSTMISCFRSCPQKFYLEFCGGFRPPGLSIDLHAGACFASALETVYRCVWTKGMSLPDALTVAHGHFMVLWGDFEIPEWKETAKTKDRVWEAVEDYFVHYSPKTDHIQPYFTPSGEPTFEYTFAIPLEPTCDPSDTNRRYGHAFPLHPSGSPFLYCGRLDMLGSYSGKPVGRDEKTTGRTPGQDWSKKWDFRSQFIGYTWALREAGIDADTIVCRGVGILKTKFHFPEAIKVYSDFDRARWLEQLRRDLWRIRRSWDEGYFDFNIADTCTQYGICPFLDSCKSPNPETWLGAMEVRHWNPLNKNPAKEPQNVAA